MIGIIGAMEEEVAALREEMQVEEVVEKAFMTFTKGTLYNKEVIVARSGIGKVSAAVCAQILVDDFKVDTLINTGVAGSLDSKLDIGDIVVSKDLVQHDMDTSALGDPVGLVSRLDMIYFPADEKLIQLAAEANEKVNPDIHTYIGRVASGDQFIASSEIKEKIVSNFGAMCAEMEGAAIAHVAYLNKVSCVIIRAISDKADNSAHMDYPEFEKVAIVHGLRLIRELIRNI